MEPGRDSRSPLRSQRLDYEVQGGNLCKMQAECNLFALTYGSTRDLTVLTSAKYRDPLNLDQHLRTCETSADRVLLGFNSCED